ncbi:MAG TPA: family 1 glycosylhydrolase [Acidimicrobiales bacterium]|jgi:beta-glucosidase|nr:family 1 glycosylhydrolase [Acidimicrobiales bacterium]
MAETGRSRKFPQGFTWGTATAAHQVEGGNVNNDWWAFEHTSGSACTEPSGDACDSWARWEEDIDLVAGLGLDNYRFSIEWSRVEPADGEFSQAALAHYRRQCLGLRERGLDPVVTFHHFTTPLWLTGQGGWESDVTLQRFARFCSVVAEALGDVMTRACTINEPNIVATMGWLVGMFPPGKTEVGLSRHVAENFVHAHRLAVDAIRSAAPGVPVGLTLSMTDYQLAPGGEEKLDGIRHHAEDIFLDATKGDDFLGVQTYSRQLIGPNGWAGYEEGVPVLDMGYEFYPASLGNCIRRAWEYTGGSVPLLVTENGIGTTDDEQRIDYVRLALSGVLDAIDEGIDVRGYTYWSLLDNFEWALGYRPRFGIVSVDRDTFTRTAKPSAAWLASVAAANALDA